MSTQKLQAASKKTGIPTKELKRLLALPYTKGELPRPIAIKNIGFAKEVIGRLREELDPYLKQGRKDAQDRVNTAFRLIICNLIVCVFSKRRLSLAGMEKAYNKGEYLNSLFLTFRSVNTVTNALFKGKYITFTKGSKAKEEVNSYKPTKKLELLLLPLLYEIQEVYSGEESTLVVFKPKKDKAVKTATEVNKISFINSKGTTKNHTMRRCSYNPNLPLDHPDVAGLKRINEYLQNVTYALKSPVKRIYSYEDPLQGGRLYVRLQGLPDRRARIRINTLLNGKPVAEVDLSANHPRMLMALDNEELPNDFYADIAIKSKTTREQVKFLVTRAIGASNRRVSLKPDFDQKEWHKKDFVITPKERVSIENIIKSSYPTLYGKLYKGMGIYLQGLEGDILLKTMVDLVNQDIPSLPIHDAIYVQKRHRGIAKRFLERNWMETLGTKFKPITKTDMS